MEGLKNIVVLKNLPSNIIEEAFIVVKPNLKIEKIENKSKGKNKIKCETNYIMKEAEYIIEDYIKEIEQEKNFKDLKAFKIKYKRLKRITLFFGMIAILGIIINFF